MKEVGGGEKEEEHDNAVAVGKGGKATKGQARLVNAGSKRAARHQVPRFVWWAMGVFVTEHQEQRQHHGKEGGGSGIGKDRLGGGLTAGSTRRHKAKSGNPIGESITKTR